MQKQNKPSWIKIVMKIPQFNWGREIGCSPQRPQWWQVDPTPDWKLSNGLVFFPASFDSPSLVGPILYLICMHAHSASQGPLGSIQVS